MATTTYFGAQNPLSMGISRSPPHSGPVLDSSELRYWMLDTRSIKHPASSTQHRRSYFTASIVN
jgi:hypothetical protein